jgi:hypothetical protein
MLHVASLIDADILLFSTLKDNNSTEIKELSSYLSEKNLKIPAFIIAEKVLFSDALVDISSYFQLRHRNDEFPKGPIIV